MALTNEQITAQNFKSFYNQIRPYLNGNVPTFANTFNRSDLYSTDEQLIGRWIDGKPIYQKSIIASNPVVGNNTIPHNITNLDRVVKCDGTVMRNGDNFTFSLPICYVPNVTQWSIATSGISKSTVNITVGDGFTGTYALSDLVITLQYTKTTDVSMSISDGNEYSTDEQIVGKWIDGRPIYQKTVQGTTPASSGTRVDVGLPTLVQIIDVEGYVVDKDDWTIFVGTQKQEGVINQDFFVCHNVSGDSKIWFGCGSSIVNRPYTLTFRYIKSS